MAPGSLAWPPGMHFLRTLRSRMPRWQAALKPVPLLAMSPGNAVIDDVDLSGENSRIAAATMVGGLVGAISGKLIKNCDGAAIVVLTGSNDIFAQCAGVLIGGDEGTDVENCHATGGTVTASGEIANDTGVNDLGGLAGCVMSTDHLTDSSDEDVAIRANEGAMLIVGLTGFSGSAESGAAIIQNCTAKNIVITAPASAERIGGITGGGFYVAQCAQYYPVPLSVEILQCTAENVTVYGGRVTGTIAGYLSEDSVVLSYTGEMTHSGAAEESEVGGTPEVLSLSEVGYGRESTDFGTWTQAAGNSGTGYSNLFSVILNAKHDALWEKSAAESLKKTIDSGLYGEAAVNTYAGSTNYAFDCRYLPGAEGIAFLQDGNSLTAVIAIEDGDQKIYHYGFLGSCTVGDGETMPYGGTQIPVSFDADLYCAREDAGDFQYFVLRDDTMETTYHMEFRYGSDVGGLLQFRKGPYAYWLSAGIDEKADGDTIVKVIVLFVRENFAQ